MSVKINTLEVENLKRIKAVKIDCSGKQLTVIGGRNGQGKTSVLDAIAYALGGERYRPTNAQREDSVIPPEIRLTLSNGLIVERKGKNSALKVTDPKNGTSGQQLLSSFIHQFALDLPRFMQSSSREKAEALLQIIGLGDQLKELERQEKQSYDERHQFGQIADQKKKYAEEMPYHPDAPEDLISVSQLIKEQQEILAKNGENQRNRMNVLEMQTHLGFINRDIGRLKNEIEQLQADLVNKEMERSNLEVTLKTASKSASEIEDASTAEIETRIRDIETINNKVRANLDKQKAVDDAEEYQRKYADQTRLIEEIREKKRALLDGANLPLSGLTVEQGELLYLGQPWDGMSGSEQLKVSTAIVRKLNPQCGFVLLDKLEQMDLETLREFGEWLEAEGLQVIATRVSTGSECSIIIEDGTGTLEVETVEAKPTYKAGAF